jgi:hypothetical protein
MNERVPAYIDDKDVTTDWLDNIFDTLDFLYSTRRQIGIVAGCVVSVSWHSNVVEWQVSKDMGGDYNSAYLILEERLKSMESKEQNVYSEIKHENDNGKLCIWQSFYFRDE